MCSCVYVYVWVHTCVRAHVCVHVCFHACDTQSIYSLLYSRTHTRTHDTHIHIHTHTHTHTHVRARKSRALSLLLSLPPSLLLSQSPCLRPTPNLCCMWHDLVISRCPWLHQTWWKTRNRGRESFAYIFVCVYIVLFCGYIGLFCGYLAFFCYDVWHDSIICMAWLIHMCYTSQSCSWHDSLTSMWHDSFVCASWRMHGSQNRCLIHVCDTNGSCHRMAKTHRMPYL